MRRADPASRTTACAVAGGAGAQRAGFGVVAILFHAVNGEDQRRLDNPFDARTPYCYQNGRYTLYKMNTKVMVLAM